jgi:hypothetical protein
MGLLSLWDDGKRPWEERRLRGSRMAHGGKRKDDRC